MYHKYRHKEVPRYGSQRLSNSFSIRFNVSQSSSSNDYHMKYINTVGAFRQ